MSSRSCQSLTIEMADGTHIKIVENGSRKKKLSMIFRHCLRRVIKIQEHQQTAECRSLDHRAEDTDCLELVSQADRGDEEAGHQYDQQAQWRANV